MLLIFISYLAIFVHCFNQNFEQKNMPETVIFIVVQTTVFFNMLPKKRENVADLVLISKQYIHSYMKIFSILYKSIFLLYN